jgi:hypothetical protein
MQAGGLSAVDAQKLREFEREGHDRLAPTYKSSSVP